MGAKASKSAVATRSVIDWMKTPETTNYFIVDKRKNRLHVIMELLRK